MAGESVWPGKVASPRHLAPVRLQIMAYVSMTAPYPDPDKCPPGVGFVPTTAPDASARGRRWLSSALAGTAFRSSKPIIGCRRRNRECRLADVYLIGVDAGTSTCKAALVSTDGRIVRVGRAPTRWSLTPTGPETDPESFIDSVLMALDEVVRPGIPGTVAGLGVTSLAETGVLLDASGEVAAPAISWADTRGENEQRDLFAAIDPDRFSITTGLIPHPRLSVVKYWWLRRHHDDSKRGVRWLDVASWIVHRLGGRQVAERSLAGRTGFMRLEGPGWWDESLSLVKAPPGLMAPLARSGDPAGTLRAGIAALDGAVLTVAGHDHLVAAAGSGASRLGDLFVSCGTAEAFLRSMPALPSDDFVAAATGAGACVGWHVLPDRNSVLIGTPTGRALKRALTLLGAENPSEVESSGPSSAPKDLVFHGLGDEAATLEGIGWSTGRSEVWSAAVAATAEGSALLRDITEQLLGPASRTIAAGGWTESATFLSSRRAIFGDLTLSPVREAGARGAALAAGVAAGILGWESWDPDRDLS